MLWIQGKGSRAMVKRKFMDVEREEMRVVGVNEGDVVERDEGKQMIHCVGRETNTAFLLTILYFQHIQH